MSWEKQAAREMARLQRRLGCLTLPREARIKVMVNWLDAAGSEHVAERERLRAEHVRSCDKCGGDREDFCLWIFESKHSEKLDALRDEMSALRSAIILEKDDEAYSAEAMRTRVDYEEHVDGWCKYWQNLRYRRFKFAGFLCEICGERKKARSSTTSIRITGRSVRGAK